MSAAPRAGPARVRPATRVASLAFAAFLGWNAGALVRGPWRELDVPRERWRAALTLGERERVERWLSENETRYGFRAGYPVELLRAIEHEVPLDGVVNALVPSAPPACAGMFPMLQALCFPRQFLPLSSIPADWPRSAQDYDPRIYILACGPQRPADLAPTFLPVVAGADWDLWRCREGPP